MTAITESGAHAVVRAEPSTGRGTIPARGGKDSGEDGNEADANGVILSPDFPIAHLRQSYATEKRAAFLLAVGLTNAMASFASIALARLIVDNRSLGRPYLWLSLASSAAVFAMTIVSRPDRQRSAGAYLEEWVEAAREAFAVGLILVLVAFFWRPKAITNFSFSRGTVLLAVPLLFVFIGVLRSAERAALLKLRRRGHNLASVVVIGESPSAAAFMRTIHSETGTGYRVLAHIPDPGSIDSIQDGLTRLAMTVPLDEVVIATSELSALQIQAIYTHPLMRGVRVRAIPELFGLPPSKVQMVDFADFPLLTLFENPVRGIRWRIKRSFDLAVALITLLFLAPVMIAIAIAIRMTSEGPILFRQTRVGMDCQPFEVLKFRTMITNAPDAVHREFMAAMLKQQGDTAPREGFYKLADDPRITRVGRVLRRFSLDEFPQLFNVLRGEMSIVGPRPALAYEVEHYEEWQLRRFDVLPGMTGLWQVSGRSRLSPADMLRLDVHYAETWSLPKDLAIMLRTLPAVLRRDAV
jgi:exopolysaccharide biosynthesis polyprenyl glycosylphosphotransferase